MLDHLDQRVADLWQEQLRSWPVLRENLELLRRSRTRRIEFDGGRFGIDIQYNAARITSVSAKVDAESIRKRECFLCDRNRPIEQRGLDCGNGYKVLCNPFPILPEHFTIVCLEHRPQLIRESFPVMLEFTGALGPRYSVFYNGPQCGASAPDHLHFQAGTAAFLPIDREYANVRASVGRRSDGVEVSISRDYLRQFVALESDDLAAAARAFETLHEAFGRISNRTDTVEPMMNVACHGSGRTVRVIAFLRSRHRPAVYEAPEPDHIMVSPGAVDIAGLLVSPREKDFRRFTPDLLRQVYGEVSVSPNAAMRLAETIVAAR